MAIAPKATFSQPAMNAFLFFLSFRNISLIVVACNLIKFLGSVNRINTVFAQSLNSPKDETFGMVIKLIVVCCIIDHCHNNSIK